MDFQNNIISVMVVMSSHKHKRVVWCSRGVNNANYTNQVVSCPLVLVINQEYHASSVL